MWRTLQHDDIKIYVTGISEDNPLTINQYVDNKWVRLHTYTTDGIYIVKNRNLYVGFGTYITTVQEMWLNGSQIYAAGD